MTAQLDIERVLDDFLGDGTDELSDRVLEAAIRDTEHVHQRRAWRVPRRYSDMPTPVRLLAVAAILAAALGGAFLLGGTVNRTTNPEPAPPPTPAVLEPVELGANPGGEWTAARPAAFGMVAGTYTMALDDSQTVLVRGSEGREVFLGSLEESQSPGTAVLGPTDRCTASGTYNYALSADFRTLSIELGSDACTDRAAVLAGNWDRSGIRYTLGQGQPYTVDLQPRVTFAVPAGFNFDDGTPPEITVPLIGAQNELWVDAENYLVHIWTDDEVPSDRCNQGSPGRPMPATLDEFVEWNRSSTGVNTGEPIHTTVGGHDAIAIDVGGTDDCPNFSVGPNCGCVPGLNLTDVDGTLFERTWGVDVDGRIVIVLFHDDNPPWLELTPERLAVAQQFIDSIQFE